MNKYKIFNVLLVFLALIGTMYAANYDFEIDIDHDFDDGEEIECELDFGPTRTYTFDEDSDNDDLKIENDFDESLEFNCDEKLDRIDFTIYNSDNDEVVEIRYEDEKFFFYELNEYDITLEINHDFEDETIICEYSYDSGDEEELILNSSSSSNSLEIEESFLEIFEIACDDDIDEFDVKVEDGSGFDVLNFDVEDNDEFVYEISKEIPQFYEFKMQIYENFDEDTECDVNIDDNYDKNYVFDDNERLSNMKIEVSFGEFVEVDCDSSINLAFVEIVNNTFNLNKQIFNESFESVSSYDFDLRNFEPAEIEEEKEEVVVSEAEDDYKDVTIDIPVEKEIEEDNENFGKIKVVLENESSDETLGIGGNSSNKNASSTNQTVTQTDEKSELSMGVKEGLRNGLVVILAFVTVTLFVYGLFSIFA